MAEVISVSALNRYVKMRLDADDVLFDLALRGEIANFVQNARSGHCYFTLRDDACSVKAVMFRSDAARLAFRPQEGMRVVVRCRATLYERDGAFQLYVNAMFPDGMGAAQLALEQLKEKLAKEGLFDPEHKKPLPAFPQCIGVVTSKTGAALQDIRNVIGRRWPAAKLLLCPVTVQGFEAAQQVADAIRRLDQRKDVDEIVVARGIGHEIDYTILDFVADQRAPTPSAAAELAVPDRAEQKRILLELQQNIRKNMQNRLDLCYNGLEQYNYVLEQHLPDRLLQKNAAALQQLQDSIRAQLREKETDASRQLQHAAVLADSLNPYRVLARGYAMMTTEKGKILSEGALQPEQTVYIRSASRRARCRVEAVEELNENT